MFIPGYPKLIHSTVHTNYEKYQYTDHIFRGWYQMFPEKIIQNDKKTNSLCLPAWLSYSFYQMKFLSFLNIPNDLG